MSIYSSQKEGSIFSNFCVSHLLSRILFHLPGKSPWTLESCYKLIFLPGRRRRNIVDRNVPLSISLCDIKITKFTSDRERIK